MGQVSLHCGCPGLIREDSGYQGGSLQVTSRAQPEPLRRPEAGTEVLFGSVCFSPEWQEEAAEASLTRERRPQPPPPKGKHLFGEVT